MPIQLSEQVVVISGVGSGIGRATIRLFASHGARLAVGGRNSAVLNALEQEMGNQCVTVPTDVAERDQVERLANVAVERFDRIDTWVNKPVSLSTPPSRRSRKRKRIEFSRSTSWVRYMACGPPFRGFGRAAEAPLTTLLRWWANGGIRANWTAWARRKEVK